MKSPKADSSELEKVASRINGVHPPNSFTTNSESQNENCGIVLKKKNVEQFEALGLTPLLSLDDPHINKSSVSENNSAKSKEIGKNPDSSTQQSIIAASSNGSNSKSGINAKEEKIPKKPNDSTLLQKLAAMKNIKNTNQPEFDQTASNNEPSHDTALPLDQKMKIFENNPDQNRTLHRLMDEKHKQKGERFPRESLETETKEASSSKKMVVNGIGIKHSSGKKEETIELQEASNQKRIQDVPGTFIPAMPPFNQQTTETRYNKMIDQPSSIAFSNQIDSRPASSLEKRRASAPSNQSPGIETETKSVQRSASCKVQQLRENYSKPNISNMDGKNGKKETLPSPIQAPFSPVPPIATTHPTNAPIGQSELKSHKCGPKSVPVLEPLAKVIFLCFYSLFISQLSVAFSCTERGTTLVRLAQYES